MSADAAANAFIWMANEAQPRLLLAWLPYQTANESEPNSPHKGIEFIRRLSEWTSQKYVATRDSAPQTANSYVHLVAPDAVHCYQLPHVYTTLVFLAVVRMVLLLR
ncbi:hypothetical protein TcWFU_005213 [Taenia crassiceps]|uniref:Uncharacterized protein n=1 Tax=Taenia crassiceps TaxID=6207 RepID=A0ABR4Q508_9CEST